MSLAAALFLIGALIALVGFCMYLWAALGEEPTKPVAKYAGIVGGAIMVVGIFMGVGW